jgi:hypothetical protein
LSRPSPDQTSSRRLRRGADIFSWPVRCAAWAFQRRLVWSLQDSAARAAYAGVTWPFERLTWGLQRRLIWPLDDCLAGLGWPARVVLALLLLGSVTSGTLAAERLATPGPSSPAMPVVHRTAPGVIAEPRPADEAPVLQGVAPNFDQAQATSAVATRIATTSGANSAAAGAAATAPAPVQVGVVTKEVPAAALGVARRFAEAFVLYEVGAADPAVRLVLRQTAVPGLAKALAQRPPRQPAAGEAPRARVLNVVAGPRYGRTASVSVALLRLGATSELRLQLQRTGAGWRVDDVRG